MPRTKQTARKHAPSLPTFHSRASSEDEGDIVEEGAGYSSSETRPRICTTAARKCAPSVPSFSFFGPSAISSEDERDEDERERDREKDERDAAAAKEGLVWHSPAGRYVTKQTARKWAPSLPTFDPQRSGAVAKRTRDELASSEDDNDEIDLKSAKRVRSSPSASAEDSDVEGVIRDLKAQIKELHDLIDASGLALKAPPSIRKHLEARENGATAYAESIRKAIGDAYSALADDCCDAKRSGVSSDDISSAMVPFIKNIEKLSGFPGPNSMGLALGLIVELGDYSYGELDNKGCGYGDRPSDKPADELFCRLAKARRKQDPEWGFGQVLEDLEITSKNLEEYGIDTYFCKSIPMLRQWGATQPR